MEFKYFTRALSRWDDFRRRASRGEYWWFVLFNMIIGGVAGVVFPRLGTLYSLFVLVPTLSLTVRRLHDIGRSWQWILVSLIPVAGPIWLLTMLAQRGDPEPNAFGPNPIGEELDFDG